MSYLSSNLTANTRHIYDVLKVKSNGKEIIFTLQSKRESKYNRINSRTNSPNTKLSRALVQCCQYLTQ